MHRTNNSSSYGMLVFFSGKMGSGKSTRAVEIADQIRAVLFSEDEWLAALYPDEIHDLEVGPFFVLEHVPFTQQYYRGDACLADISVALAYSGEVQIELVMQHNEAPSIFRDFLRQRGEGLQHVGAITPDLDAALLTLADRQVNPVQWGRAENGTRFAYLGTDQVPGAMLELFELPEKVAGAFAYMRKAAQKWQPGVDPVRR